MNIHPFLTKEILLLIIHLNSQNISFNFEQGFAVAGCEVCPPANVNINVKIQTALLNWVITARECETNQCFTTSKFCQNGTKPMFSYWPSEGAGKQCRTRLQPAQRPTRLPTPSPADEWETRSQNSAQVKFYHSQPWPSNSIWQEAWEGQASSCSTLPGELWFLGQWLRALAASPNTARTFSERCFTGETCPNGAQR